MDETLARQRSAILQAARRCRLGDVRVFGSRAAGTAGPGSDLDLLVRLEPGGTLFDLVRFREEVERLVGCPVDVVTEGALSPYLRDEILRTAQPLEAA